MKNILVFMIAVALTSNAAFAIDCPKFKLNCHHKVLDGKTFSFKTIETKSVEFVGFNSDEPSMPANECEANISFKSLKPSESLNVVVKEDLHTYMYVGINYGAKNPQFDLEAELNKEMSLSVENEKLVCSLSLN
jgi:hypothetical protein